MKLYCSCLLIVSLAVLSGCVSMSGYKEASQRHYAYASGEEAATAAEWRDLASEFQEVIDTNTQGRFADNAQYAIASSWMWSIKTGDTEAPQEAIEAFHKLVRTYPNSPYVPHAYYWLGRCYDYIDKDYQAITQYQIVESRYADSELLEPSQLELARLYARRGYITRAETFYSYLINSSINQEIVSAASVELQALKSQEKQVVLPPKNREQTQGPNRQTKPKSEPNRNFPHQHGYKELDPESLRVSGLIAETML